MGIETIRIRRGIEMVPVYDVPMANTHDCKLEYDEIVLAWLKDEIKDWLTSQGLPDDAMSNEWTVFDHWVQRSSTFFFTDPQKAMLFKLTWA